MNIHVNDAKKLLFSFYKKHKDLVEATYLISGTLDGSTDLKIKMTKDINDKEKFDQIQSIQIYSLSPQHIKFDEIVSTVNSQLKNYTVDEKKLAKWGIIKGPELVKIEHAVAPQKDKPQPIAAAKKVDTKEAPAPSKKKEFPDMGLRSAQILNRNRKAEDEKPKTRTTTQPTFGSSRKQATSEPERSKTEPATKAAKPVHTEDTKKMSAARAEKEKKQKELESMFDDDDDDIMMEEGKFETLEIVLGVLLTV